MFYCESEDGFIGSAPNRADRARGPLFGALDEYLMDEVRKAVENTPSSISPSSS